MEAFPEVSEGIKSSWHMPRPRRTRISGMLLVFQNDSRAMSLLCYGRRSISRGYNRCSCAPRFLSGLIRLRAQNFSGMLRDCRRQQWLGFRKRLLQRGFLVAKFSSAQNHAVKLALFAFEPIGPQQRRPLLLARHVPAFDLRYPRLRQRRIVGARRRKFSLRQPQHQAAVLLQCVTFLRPSRKFLRLSFHFVPPQMAGV